MPDVIAEAFVGIRPQSSGFATQLKRDVEDPTRKTARNLAVALGGAFASRKIIQFGQEALRTYNEAQSAVLKLNQAFEQSVALQGRSTERIDALADATLRLTRFDDDQVRAAAAQLAQFNLTEQQLLELLPLVQDYAARTGTDLVAASTTLGKAMLGQGRALKNIGINFKDTGTQAGNLEQLMAALNEKVGGFAEREGKTAAGQAAILSNEFGEMKEELGRVIAQGLTPMLKITTVLADGLNALPGPVKTVIGAVIVLTGVVAAGKLAMAAFTSTLEAAGIQAKGFMASLGPIGVALVAVTTILGIHAQQAREDAEAVSDLSDAMKQGTFDAEEYQKTLDNLAVRGGIAAGLAAKGQALLARAIEQTKTDVLDARDALEDLGGSLNVQESNAFAAAVAEENFGRALAIVSQAQERAARNGKLVTQTHEEQTAAAKELRLAELALAGGFIGIQSAALSAKDAQLELAEARRAVQNLAEKDKQGTDKYRDALRALEEAQVGAIEGQLGLASAVVEYLKQRGEAEAGQARVNELTREYGKDANLTKDEIHDLQGTVSRLIEDYRNLPESARTTFDTPGLDEARAQVKGLREDLLALPAFQAIRLDLQTSEGGGSTTRGPSRGNGGGGRRP